MDMFPLRVLVESVRPQHCISCAHGGQAILDTYAIVSGQTPLSQLNDSVLSALGLPHLIHDSRGKCALLYYFKPEIPIPLNLILNELKKVFFNIFIEFFVCCWRFFFKSDLHFLKWKWRREGRRSNNKDLLSFKKYKKIYIFFFLLNN